MNESIIEAFVYEYNGLKQEIKTLRKDNDFYRKELHIIHDYIRNQPYNPEREFLYKIVSAFRNESWVKWLWDNRCFSMPYYTKNMKIYNDVSYDYNEFAKKYVPTLFPNEIEEWKKFSE